MSRKTQHNKSIQTFKSRTRLLQEHLKEQREKPIMLTMEEQALLACSQQTFANMMLMAQMHGYHRLVYALKAYLYFKSKLEVKLLMMSDERSIEFREGIVNG